MKSKTSKRLAVTGLLIFACLWALSRAADALAGNADMVFYGRVVDEWGTAVDGVEVKGEVLGNSRIVMPSYWGGGVFSDKVAATSDYTGRFVLRYPRATSLRIRQLRKPGYRNRLEGEGDPRTWDQFLFHYKSQQSPGQPVALHVPDPDHPVVFHLRQSPD